MPCWLQHGHKPESLAWSVQRLTRQCVPFAQTARLRSAALHARDGVAQDGLITAAITVVAALEAMATRFEFGRQLRW